MSPSIRNVFVLGGLGLLLVLVLGRGHQSVGEDPRPDHAVAAEAPIEVGTISESGNQGNALSRDDRERSPDEEIAALLRQRVDLGDAVAREELVTKIRSLEARKEEQLRIRAAELGYAKRNEDGAVLVGFADDGPLYDIDHNASAAISSGAGAIRQTGPYNADGEGYLIGLWEAGDVPRTTHQEFGGRVTVVDGTTRTDAHASHVAGTLMAAGVVANLKGMSPAAELKAHDTSSEVSEMTALAAAVPGEAGKIRVSNHSYGTAIGWNDAASSWYGSYYTGSGTYEAARFGQYTTTSASWDGIMWNAPYYLAFKSAGNDRNDDAPASGDPWKLNGGGSDLSYTPGTHPTDDFSWKVSGSTSGFGTIGHRASCKNSVAVGSVTDAVSGGVRSPGVAALNSFSSAGPTDDGRIKPDLMANGNALTSCSNASDTATASMSGTSMSTPNACGSALLLIDYYESLFPGGSLLASTLKGLLIHTADDLGNPGPDYRFGWGLINVKAAADVLKEHAASTSEDRLAEGVLSAANPADEFTILSDGGGELRVTICWTDPAGSGTSVHDSRAAALVHDLNLTVTGPDGTHLPFVMPWVGDWTDAKLDANATTGVNSVDNVEQVFLAAPVGGLYTIRVDHAGALTQGPQAYSLLLSGAALSDSLTDSDGDGLSDAFEVAHSGSPTLLEAEADLDGDGLTALAEFAHGLDPHLPLAAPVDVLSVLNDGGEDYLVITYEVDPMALFFLEVDVQRRIDLNDPNGWEAGQTLLLSEAPSTTNPGMTERVERSITPMQEKGVELLRIRQQLVAP